MCSSGNHNDSAQCSTNASVQDGSSVSAEEELGGRTENRHLFIHGYVKAEQAATGIKTVHIIVIHHTGASMKDGLAHYQATWT